MWRRTTTTTSLVVSCRPHVLSPSRALPGCSLVRRPPRPEEGRQQLLHSVAGSSGGGGVVVVEVHFYYDHRSPFAYLAKDLVYGLEDSHPPDRVRVRWLPFAFPVEEGFGLPGSRSSYHANKVKYAYVDVRRWANERNPPLVIKGPQRVFDSTRANATGLFAQSLGRPVFRAYTDRVYREFFERTLDIEQEDAIMAVLRDAITQHAEGPALADGWEARYETFVSEDGEARRQLAAIREMGEKEGVFGVPSFVLGGDLFFGADRFDWVKRRLDALLATRDQLACTTPS